MKINWDKIDEAIEKALEAPSPQLAIHHLINRVLENPPEERNDVA